MRLRLHGLDGLDGIAANSYRTHLAADNALERHTSAVSSTQNRSGVPFARIIGPGAR
jgi:hypothetical protein